MDSTIDVDLQQEIAQQWQHLRVNAAQQISGAFHLVIGTPRDQVVPNTRLALARDSEHAPDLLASTLTFARLRELAGSTYLFHAAGLSARDGRVIALVGPSGRGKTTAAVELGKSMGYVTDETVAFRHDLSVIPYPKPLSIGKRPGVKMMHSPETLGMRMADGPLRLGALALLDRREEPVEPYIEEVSPLEAIGELVEQCSSVADLPNPLQSIAEVVTRTGGVRKLIYSDAKDLRTLVDDVLAAQPMESPEIATVDLEVIAPTRAESVSRSDVIDALWIDGRLAVLTEGSLHVLDGIGPEIWKRAEDSTPLEISKHLRDLLGDPPVNVDLMQTVSAAIANMVDANLLQYGHG